MVASPPGWVQLTHLEHQALQGRLLRHSLLSCLLGAHTHKEAVPAWCSQKGCVHHTAQQHLQPAPRQPARTAVMSKEAASSASMTPAGSFSSGKFLTACTQVIPSLVVTVVRHGTACRPSGDQLQTACR